MVFLQRIALHKKELVYVIRTNNVHIFRIKFLIILSSTCFEYPSVHPQEDFYMHFYGIPFMHLYKQSGRWQDVFQYQAHPAIDQDCLILKHILPSTKTAWYSSTSCHRPDCLILKHIVPSTRRLDTQAHPAIDQSAWYSSTSWLRSDCLILQHILPSTKAALYSSTSCLRPDCFILQHFLPSTRLLDTQAHPVIDQTPYYSSTSCHRPNCLILKQILSSTRLLLWIYEWNTIKLHVQVFLRMNTWMFKACRRHSN
jgi:hypothetical protein